MKRSSPRSAAAGEAWKVAAGAARLATRRKVALDELPPAARRAVVAVARAALRALDPTGRSPGAAGARGVGAGACGPATAGERFPALPVAPTAGGAATADELARVDQAAAVARAAVLTEEVTRALRRGDAGAARRDLEIAVRLLAGGAA